MKCSISPIAQLDNGNWGFTYIDEKGASRVIENADKEQCEVLQHELIGAFRRDDEYRSLDSDGVTLFEKIPKVKKDARSLPDELDPDFFLKILRRFARQIAMDPYDKDIQNAARAVGAVAAAARGWQDNADLIKDMNDFKSFMDNYYKANRVGSSVIRSASRDAEVPRIH